VAGMRLSSHVEIPSRELDLAGNDDSSLLISSTVVGSKSDSGGTSLGMMTGVAAVAVDAQMSVTLLTKDLAKSSALSLLVMDCTGGCSMALPQ